jgi:hypothetical protein
MNLERQRIEHVNIHQEYDADKKQKNLQVRIIESHNRLEFKTNSIKGI